MAKLPPPPGRRLVKRMSTRTKWLLLAPISLMLVGAGLCVLSEAGHAKHTGGPFRQWFLIGLYGLILVNGGLSLFGQAVRYRVQLDYRRFVRREFKKREGNRRKRKSSSGRDED
ncbi:hypothetical protein [Spirosoma knui]